jgi:hypothetical protein
VIRTAGDRYFEPGNGSFDREEGYNEKWIHCDEVDLSQEISRGQSGTRLKVYTLPAVKHPLSTGTDRFILRRGDRANPGCPVTLGCHILTDHPESGLLGVDRGGA